MQFRPVDPEADRPIILDLLAVAGQGDPSPVSEEAERHILAGSEPAGLLAVTGEEVAAYLHLRLHRAVAVLEPVFAPETDRGLRARIVAEAVASIPDNPLHLWTADASAAEAAVRCGLRRDRRVVCLQRPLPIDDAVAYPGGVRPAVFRPGVDEEALLLVRNEAFAGHPAGEWDRGALAWRVRLPWFRAEGVTLAWEQGRPIGVCWTKAAPAGIGEIYLIGTRPSAARRGVGLAMTVAGLRSLAAEGATTGRIFTDHDNRPALRLYGELGFEQVSVRCRFVRG